MSILTVLVGIGMTPLTPKLERAGPPEVLHVLLDGCVVGSIASGKVEKAVAHLRSLKLFAVSGVSPLVSFSFIYRSLFLSFFLA